MRNSNTDLVKKAAAALLLLILLQSRKIFMIYGNTYIIYTLK
jgi:hypothetical protein